jgi:hypothetical protein
MAARPLRTTYEDLTIIFDSIVLKPGLSKRPLLDHRKGEELDPIAVVAFESGAAGASALSRRKGGAYLGWTALHQPEVDLNHELSIRVQHVTQVVAAIDVGCIRETRSDKFIA